MPTAKGICPLAARRRWLVQALAAAAVPVLSGCQHLLAPSRVVLSEVELQRLMSGQFPVEQRLLEIFEVRAHTPQLRLLPERNRLAAQVNLQARERILGTRSAGRLDFDSALRWDPVAFAVRLDQVRVVDFVLDAPANQTAPGVPAPAGGVKTATAADTARRSSTERLAAAAAERLLEGLVLYRLPEDKRAQMIKAGVRPATLNITRSGLEITLEPQPK